ncbi:uncharacterized protein BDV14DRAFT_176570 [Aspergillus stella-maris]|uniref:uncharacterized protein n=1 Tax=Aspergillus stella-maris TaxID=1810926 RepID=UPI003CCCB7BC
MFALDLLVPPNSRALVTLPLDTYSAGSEEQKGEWAGSGRHSFSVPFDWEKYTSQWPPKPRLPFMRKPQPDSIV